MKIEPVLVGRVALHEYSSPSCGIFKANAALSDDVIRKGKPTPAGDIDTYKRRSAG
jgi:hypothetical protein